MTVPENNEALASAVRNWIADTGLTQAMISAAGGPSSTTMTKILSGEGTFRSAVFADLDRGLGWGDGKAADVWRGVTVAADIDWRNATDRQLLDELGRRLAERSGSDGRDAKKTSAAADGSNRVSGSAAGGARQRTSDGSRGTGGRTVPEKRSGRKS